MCGGGGGSGGGDEGNMGIDDSVADQSAVSGDTSTVGDDPSGAGDEGVSTSTSSSTTSTNTSEDNFSNMDNFSMVSGQNFSAPNTGNMGLGMVDDYGLYSSVTDDNVTTDPDAGLSYSAIASIGNVANQAQPDDITGFGGKGSDGRDVSDFSTDLDADDAVEDQAKRGLFPNFAKFSPIIGGLINQVTKSTAQTTMDNLSRGYAPTYGPDGNITGTTGFGIGMGQPGGVFGGGRSVEGYQPFSDTSPSIGMYGGTTNIGGNENDTPQIIRRNPSDPVQDDPTDPVISDELASDYLQNPFYLYSGQGNLYQPYGYAANTLVNLLRTRNMTQPQQRAANLGLFGNPGDFS